MPYNEATVTAVKAFAAQDDSQLVLSPFFMRALAIGVSAECDIDHCRFSQRQFKYTQGSTMHNSEGVLYGGSAVLD